MNEIQRYGRVMGLYALIFGLTGLCFIGPVLGSSPIRSPLSGQVSQVAAGVWRIRFGTPESFVPTAFRERDPMTRQINALPEPQSLPFALTEVRCSRFTGRLAVYVPCNEPEDEIYGFGLDPGAYRQKGLRKWLSVSAAVVTETGASHGPVPFYVSTRGYGVLVDTARVPFVHVARLSPKAAVIKSSSAPAGDLETSVSDLYAARSAVRDTEVVFDIPCARGVDVYIFGGPTLREAVQRYNLFSGGGCIPPMWGLGLKYRTYTRGNRDTVMRVADTLRKQQVPCDMIGLEPGWQTHAYSCSLVWSGERFPDHQTFVDRLRAMGYHVNLWEHAYIHPSSPLFEPLQDRSGDFLVWGGLVVDFADPKAFETFADYHDQAFIQQGISGFKADECDRQPITDSTPFNYPYCSTFPSGIDGDQMTQLYGYLYQRSVYSAFKKHNLRTWGDVRATTSLAAPLPFNLYSDAYQEDQYLRQLLNASYAGLLWSPEVRSAPNLDEFLSRLGIAAFAPQTCLNIWSIPNPIWTQFDEAKNRKNQLLPEQEQQVVINKVRELLNLRMSLLPYFYSAFYAYRYDGLPPARALPIEFPGDKRLRTIEDAYLFGDTLLVAPILGTGNTRTVTLPAGTDWIDFYTNKRYAGGTEPQITATAGRVPLFVKDNTILPVAKPVECVADDTVFEITARVYGDKPVPFTLFEDDGVSFDYEQGQYNRVTLSWENGKGHVERSGQFAGRRFRIAAWDKVNSPKTKPQVFFAFDNGLGQVESLEAKAALLKELGYDGIGWRVGVQPAEMIQALDKNGLRMVSTYVGATVDSDNPRYDTHLDDEIDLMKKHKTIIWLFMTRTKNSDDNTAVTLVNQVADLAEHAGLEVVLYPHAGLYVATVEDALRIAKKVNRSNVGVSFNLCHFLKTDEETHLKPVLTACAPYLRLVSINGADSGDTQAMGWDRLIRPLGEGSFDVRQVMTLLHEIGYTGPVGLQCYNVKGDNRDNLKKSITAWKALTQNP